MRKVWFTADTHFGHKRIPFYAGRTFCLDEREKREMERARTEQKIRWSPGWDAVRRMDEKLIANINGCVDRDDILWHLGDFCWGKSDRLEEAARKYREQIKCRNVYLVAGNHDEEQIWRFFSGCYQMKEIKVASRHVVLCHYAHSFWNRSHYGSWMLYGHAHGTAESWLDEHMPGRLSMDVGVDNVARITGEYRPISSDEVAFLFSSRKGCQIDGNKIGGGALQVRKSG